MVVKEKFITVDGVDGVGKSVLTEAFRRYLERIGEKVKVFSINEKLSSELKLLAALNQAIFAKDKKRMQNVYLAAWNRLMAIIDESLAENWVVLDSSPIRSVAFYKGVDEALHEVANMRWEDKTITRGLLPARAALLEADPNLILRRIKKRSQLEQKTSYDPNDLDAVRTRAIAYRYIFDEKYGGQSSIKAKIIDVSKDDKETFDEAVEFYLSSYVNGFFI